MTASTTTVPTTRRSFERAAYATLAASLLASVVYEALERGASDWLIVAFAIGPDLAAFLGFGKGLAKGQLHPRAVRTYNAMHRFIAPIGLAVLVVCGLAPHVLFAGALAWSFHIALDRTVGYGLRTHDGFQRS
jgi:hypothetical protein